jgi:dihydrofolate reductase
MIVAIFAVDEESGIGKEGKLPWSMIKEDMKWFKENTQDQVVVMGKKSWDSPDMLKPLPKRHNVVFTNNFFDFNVEQIKGDVCESLKLLESQHPNKTIFVIGGANIIAQSVPVLDKILLTRVPGTYDCDTFIPLDDILPKFNLINVHQFETCKVEEYEAIPRRT